MADYEDAYKAFREAWDTMQAKKLTHDQVFKVAAYMMFTSWRQMGCRTDFTEAIAKDVIKAYKKLIKEYLKAQPAGK